MARVLMWLNYRRKYNVSVPSPYDGDHTIPWWYDKISMMAKSLAENGVTDVLFPNPIKCNAGAFPGSDGYGPFDDYDIGSKNTMQFGGVPTRFGYADQLRRAIAICHANGLNVLIDHVMHQRMGGRNGTYEYLGSDGKTKNGRFAKTPSCFLGSPPRVPRDPIPDVPDDFAFGDELCPVNAKPPGYVSDGLIAAGNWLFTTLDCDGARLDDMKGMNIDFIKKFVTSGAMKGNWFFGEYASGNRNDTDWWVSQVDALCSAADFDFHYNMAQDMCNNAGSTSFHMSWLAGRGMIGSWPMKACPFVESMDSDTNGFATIVNNKVLAYALMLGGEGLPMIYIRDYLQEPDCYGLKPFIDNLMWINRNLASGHTIARYGDQKTFIFERDGDPGLIVALNNDVWNPDWKFINIQTGFGANVQLHDYTGHNANDCWTDWQGRVTLAVPPGPNGFGYACWSRAGFSFPTKTTSRSTTQIFYGASDLDILPATNLKLVVGHIWVAANSQLVSKVSADQTGWNTSSCINWQLIDPDGVNTGTGVLKFGGDPASISSQSTSEGWYDLVVTGTQLPSSGSPFEFQVTYMAPKSFKFVPPSNASHARVVQPDPELAKEISDISGKALDARAKRLAIKST